MSSTSSIVILVGEDIFKNDIAEWSGFLLTGLHLIELIPVDGILFQK